MTPTPTEPIVNHLGPVDGVCPQEYPIAYAHLLQSYCFELEPSTLFLYYNHQTTKRYCQFCFEKSGEITKRERKPPIEKRGITTPHTAGDCAMREVTKKYNIKRTRHQGKTSLVSRI